jgi:hypothetical protein
MDDTSGRQQEIVSCAQKISQALIRRREILIRRRDFLSEMLSEAEQEKVFIMLYV